MTFVKDERNFILYNTKNEFGNEIKYEAKKDYVDCTDIILYQAEEALMIGSYVFPFRASQYVVVLNRLPAGFTKSDPPQSVHVEQEINRFIFFKKRLHLTARMSEQLQRSGEVGKMRLIITNDTGLDVAAISIRLLRDIRGLDNICIPFRYDENVPLCSSCIGHHVQCRYCVEVVVRLVGDSIATINIPILSLLHHKDKEWYSWQPPDWVYNSEILSTNSPFSVPSHILESEAFSGIPRFQALS
ncbi:hypothetical protein KUTeg_003719 [Tegillarca granosa]|uniref:Uncharacterized protein n=1 Tax=Tegillarca granosa TaxID=220873 RepID=A0ABQ9FSF1_TEGGR|nr:hypothetical protein KUTeg_003719 [Tegillarca granosa]